MKKMGDQKYYEAHREQVKQRARERYAATREARLATSQKYRDTHKAENSARDKNDHHNFKVDYIIRLGAKCGMCGLPYNGTNAAVFDAHHRDMSEKESVLSVVSKKDKAAFELELSKCDLFCSNCHRLIHGDEY